MKNHIFAITLASLGAAAPGALLAQTANQNLSQQFEVQFAFDSDQLDAEARQIIDQAAAAFKQGGQASLVLEGHTDTVASQGYNLDLSQRRASAVSSALAARGVPVGSMRVRGVGERDLAVPTADGVRSEANRRVTIDLFTQVVSAPASTPAPAPTPVAQPTRFGLGVGPFVAWHNGDNDDSYFVGLNLTASYELTPNFEASVEQAVFQEIVDGDDGVGGRTAFGLDYHFGNSGFSPYVGANLGAIYSDGQFGTETFVGPEIGFSSGAMFGRVAYDFPIGRDMENGVLAATLGVQTKF